MNDLEIVIFETNQGALEDLEARISPIGIMVRKVERTSYFHPPEGIDALFLVLPAAEKWGAEPLIGEAQVLKTSLDDQRDGMPPYVVTGVVLRPEDPRGPLLETKILVATALDAVRQFNLAHEGEGIHKLGFWAVNLLNGVTPQQLATVFAEVISTSRSGRP
jgi:hypothetical protein